MNDNIIIVPMYSQDSSMVCFMIQREDGETLTEQDVADALRDYADVIMCETVNKEDLN